MGKICGVMRVEKRKRAAVKGLQLEANRTLEDHEKGRDFDRSDIDWSMTEQNIRLVYTENWNAEITRQIKEAGIREVKSGNNASVVMLDAVYTASPQWFEEHSKEEIIGYFQKCLDFHIEHYCGGDRFRVINAIIHLDETTPHMQVASVPIMDTGEKLKLCAKDIMGTKKDYRHRQDLFFEEVSQNFGMERGEVLEEGEIRLHTTKREWQIATQEERFEAARMKANEQELIIKKYEEIIVAQENDIKRQPHILTDEEIELLKEEHQVNKLTGRVTLYREEYLSLLGTVKESEDLRDVREELDLEKKQIEKERQSFKFEREDALEKARLEGLRQGSEEQKILMEKGQCFDDMMKLVKEDPNLEQSLKCSLEQKRHLFPRLTEAISISFEWAKDLVAEIKQKMSVKMKMS